MLIFIMSTVTENRQRKNIIEINRLMEKLRNYFF